MRHPLYNRLVDIASIIFSMHLFKKEYTSRDREGPLNKYF